MLPCFTSSHTVTKEDHRVHFARLATANALEQGLELVETIVEGKDWVQEPFPYQGKCLQWLRIEYARLDEEDRQRVDSILKGTGCEALLARPAGS